MNSFFCSIHRPFNFMGKTNEDVTAYVNHGSKGDLFLTIPFIGIEQKQTQSNDGGLTDIYKAQGTYVKSFYSLLFNPSCVKLSLMGFKENRIHHWINWENAVPKIINQKHKKYE